MKNIKKKLIYTLCDFYYLLNVQFLQYSNSE